MLENDINEEFSLNKEQKAELVRRYDDYQNGVGKTYTWEEVIEITDWALALKRANEN